MFDLISVEHIYNWQIGQINKILLLGTKNLALSKLGGSELNSVFSNLNKYFISSWDA